MKNRIFSVLCMIAVVLVFALTAQTGSFAWNVGAAEEGSSNKPAQEQPYVEPDTSATTTTQPSMPTTSSTTKKPDDSTSASTDPSTNPPASTDPTSNTTAKPPASETEPSPTAPTSERETTKKTGPTTTKKPGKTTTTTQRYTNSNNTTTTKRSVPVMNVPQVENTTIDGTTLSPMEAYFERISGSNEMAASTEAQGDIAQQNEQGGQLQLPTIAIVAICLGGIALVTVLLTAIFAIRNRRSGDEEEESAPDYEEDAYDTNVYVQQTPTQTQPPRAQVDESGSFTVVSLDDNDYTD